MDDARKNPLWPWIVALLIGLPVLYVASFGPACWITTRIGIGIGEIPRLYYPIILAMSSHDTVARPFEFYSMLGAENDWRWIDLGNPGDNPPDWHLMKIPVNVSGLPPLRGP